MNSIEQHDDDASNSSSGQDFASFADSTSKEALDGERPKFNKCHKGLTLLLSVLLAIIMSLYNSTLFNKQRYNMGLPLFAAVIYDLTQFGLAVALIAVLEWRSGPGLIVSFQLCPRNQVLRFILPCGIAAGLNVALSNSSLQLVSLSFYTMVKSSALIFLLLFAFLFRLETPTTSLVGIIFIVGIGTLLTVYNPVSFNHTGFILVLSSAVVSGLRWTLTQVIVKNSRLEDLDERHSIVGSGPLRTILYLAPVSILTLLILSLFLEGPTQIMKSSFFKSFPHALEGFGLCLLGGLQCFMVISLEYQCVKETSVLTFSISNVVKEILIIGMSVFIFGDHLRLINFIGATISILGIFLYSLYKIKRQRIKNAPEIVERRRLEGMAMQNLYIAAPVTESPWVMDPLCLSNTALLDPSHKLLSDLLPPPPPALVRCNSCRDENIRHYNSIEDLLGDTKYTTTTSPGRTHRSNSLVVDSYELHENPQI